MKRLAMLAVLPLLLSACTIPTAAVVVGAMDGVTFMGSGKSIGSHALSHAAEQDCSLLFGITRGKFCKKRDKSYDYASQDAGFVVPKNRPVVADNQVSPVIEPKSIKQQAALEPRFFDFDYETDPAAAKAEKRTDKKAIASITELPEIGRTQWTLVLGSFADFSRASKFAAMVKPEPGLISKIVADGKILYRVSTRPLSRDRAVAPELATAALKQATVRLMPVCPLGVHGNDCVALDRVLSGHQATLQ